MSEVINLDAIRADTVFRFYGRDMRLLEPGQVTTSHVPLAPGLDFTTAEVVLKLMAVPKPPPRRKWSTSMGLRRPSQKRDG
jgi:hypothetical protein